MNDVKIGNSVNFFFMFNRIICTSTYIDIYIFVYSLDIDIDDIDRYRLFTVHKHNSFLFFKKRVK